MAQEHMDSPQWVIKHTAARSVADATTALASMSSGFDATTSQLIWPVLEKALSGKTWDGKEAVLYAFAKFVETTKHVWSAEDGVAKTFVKVSDVSPSSKRLSRALCPLCIYRSPDGTEIVY